VIISRPFYLQTTEVTQAQYQALLGTNPSDYKNYVCPVEVSWHDAQKFIKRLNARECKKGINKYRLPTEAEWEYACRAGTTTAFHFGNRISADQANYDGCKYPYGGGLSGNCLSRPTPVGSYPPNQWGLYDMHGNLMEWCSDWFSASYYKNSPRRDPQGPAEGVKRVLRGGSYTHWALEVRSASRGGGRPWKGNLLTGFRVVRDY
jgi:formylglycine-generating enzyme required for sulfatase activity